MKDIANRGQANLPDLTADYAAKLVAGIAESRATTIIAGGGKPLLRMLKNGDWVFGPSNEDVQPGSPWVVNIYTFAHGFSCWVETAGNNKNELRGEVMVPMTEGKPPRPAPINGTDFTDQRSFEAKCLDGADIGTEVLHKTASIGGMRAVQKLLDMVTAKLVSPGGVNYGFPVIVLGHDHYEHTKWGRIYTPIFDVVGWANVHGELEPEGPALAPVEETASRPAAATAEPVKPRKPPLTAVAKPAEPVSTTQAHVGQRRRPTAR